MQHMTSFDYDYNSRLMTLVDLCLAHPNNKMKKLQKTALRLYPVHSKELYRHCMSWNFAFKAADIANHHLLSRHMLRVIQPPEETSHA